MKLLKLLNLYFLGILFHILCFIFLDHFATEHTDVLISVFSYHCDLQPPEICIACLPSSSWTQYLRNVFFGYIYHMAQARNTLFKTGL